MSGCIATEGRGSWAVIQNVKETLGLFTFETVLNRIQTASPECGCIRFNAVHITNYTSELMTYSRLFAREPHAINCKPHPQLFCTLAV